MDLSVKISELSGVQSHMLRINGRHRPLILLALFSVLDKLDFGDGKVAGLLSLDRFWSSSLCARVRESLHVTTAALAFSTAAHRDKLSHTARTCSSLRVNVPRGYLDCP